MTIGQIRPNIPTLPQYCPHDPQRRLMSQTSGIQDKRGPMDDLVRKLIQQGLERLLYGLPDIKIHNVTDSKGMESAHAVKGCDQIRQTVRTGKQKEGRYVLFIDHQFFTSLGDYCCRTSEQYPFRA